jgi:hypothetical protein
MAHLVGVALMPRPARYTPEQDALIRRQRILGVSWDVIAAELGRSRFAVIAHAREINAHRLGPAKVVVEQLPERGAEPLPAGHALSWASITAGTVLEGSAFG